MSNKALDPNLASILESIRATVSSVSESHAADDPVGADHSATPDAGEDVDDLAASPRERSQAAARAARTAFAKSRTIEEFLADLTRPYVQAWVNEHLPELVQKMLAEEIHRLTGRK